MAKKVIAVGASAQVTVTVHIQVTAAKLSHIDDFKTALQHDINHGYNNFKRGIYSVAGRNQVTIHKITTEKPTKEVPQS